MRLSHLLSLSALLLSTTVYASAGDRDSEFISCVSRCSNTRCTIPNPPRLSVALRLTFWTCNDDCKYSCMQEITTRAKKLGDPILQYYGKWPFWRLGGIQEPASVLFSVLNLLVHVQGARKIKRKVGRGHPMRGYYLMWSAVSVNTWVWSSVFHTRDLPITEKLDYFSAALAIIYALYYTVIRLFHLYPSFRSHRPMTMALHDDRSGSSGPHSATYKTWRLLCIGTFIAHVSYLSLLPRFDYTYNMAFNLFIGLSHNFLWLIYSLPSSISTLFIPGKFPGQPKSYNPPFVGKAAVFVFLTTFATSLELLDFPPWFRTIDAHSLWHLVTAPIALKWYDYLIQDSADLSWRGERV
ncbi:Per1-like protein [Pluteus cervinus]|uniref:Per1-like protein n=1 Tax=Pluteus cervinus TaxID=181527 RepID=A0ACD3AIX7_9AGAR|nr:Per1-like protein [Pluteus cervinus]